MFDNGGLGKTCRPSNGVTQYVRFCRPSNHWTPNLYHHSPMIFTSNLRGVFIFLICWFLDFHRFPQSRWWECYIASRGFGYQGVNNGYVSDDFVTMLNLSKKSGFMLK